MTRASHLTGHQVHTHGAREEGGLDLFVCDFLTLRRPRRTLSPPQAFFLLLLLIGPPPLPIPVCPSPHRAKHRPSIIFGALWEGNKNTRSRFVSDGGPPECAAPSQLVEGDWRIKRRWFRWRSDLWVMVMVVMKTMITIVTMVVVTMMVKRTTMWDQVTRGADVWINAVAVIPLTDDARSQHVAPSH
jgi:hypothetical protein